MKKTLVIMVLSAVFSYANMSRINVTDQESEIPYLNQVETINNLDPIINSTDLPYLPGWPVRVASNAQFSPVRGVAVADFDNDGKMEIIRPATNGQLYVWKYDGTLYPGWPKTLNNGGQEAPSVADVDLDGDYEICVNTRGLTNGGRVYLFSENGTLKPGWPYTGPHNGNFAGSPCLADINGDDTLEIIVAERNYPIGHLIILKYDGSVIRSCSLNHVPAVTPAVADINCDGVKEIVYCSYSSIYVFRPDGTILPDWPIINPNGRSFSYQSPVLADIDHDDTLEIITAMHQNGGGVYAWRYNGILCAGWPYNLPRWTYCPPTVADLYRNHDLKIICGLSGDISAPEALYAYDDNASVLTGFPVIMTSGDATEGNITVADIDNDNQMEIIFTSNYMTSADTSGYLYAVNHDGTPVIGWPLRTYGFTYLNGATVADIDGDDSLDIIAVSAQGSVMQVSVWEAGVPFNRNCWQWPTYHFDMARTGWYRSPETGLEETQSFQQTALINISPTIIRPGAAIKITITSPVKIKLDLYDITGKLITNMLNDYLSVSKYNVEIPAMVKSGIYFVCAKTKHQIINEKIIIP